MKPILVGVLSVLLLPLRAAAQQEFVVDLPEIEGTYPAGSTRHLVEWDAGVKFVEVQSILIELRAANTSNGICYGYPTVCSPSSRASIWIYTDEANRPTWFTGVSSFPSTGHSVASRVYSGPTCATLSAGQKCLQWHDSDFRAGRGILEFEFVLDESRSPGSISEAKLLLNGTPLPEPETAEEVAILAVFFLRFLTKRRMHSIRIP